MSFWEVPTYKLRRHNYLNVLIFALYIEKLFSTSATKWRAKDVHSIYNPYFIRIFDYSSSIAHKNVYNLMQTVMSNTKQL